MLPPTKKCTLDWLETFRYFALTVKRVDVDTNLPQAITLMVLNLVPMILLLRMLSLAVLAVQRRVLKVIRPRNQQFNDDKGGYFSEGQRYFTNVWA